MEEEQVDNRIIEEQIFKKYYGIMRNMKQEYKGIEITLKSSESRIMLEILRFHPDFKKKWTKGCKFVYTAGINSNDRTYYDIFIKNLQGNLITFSKNQIRQHLKKLENNFKNIIKKPIIQTTLEEFKKKFKEQVDYRKDFGICTKCFGYDGKKFVFCDCLLSRTEYNEFRCSNPFEYHSTIEGKLLKSVHYTYEQGFEGEDPNDKQSIYSKYYITNEEINIPRGDAIKKGTILYQLNERKYIIVDDMNSFRQNLRDKIAEANENKTIITIPNDYRNFKKYDEE
jgi:hypothetical protein